MGIHCAHRVTVTGVGGVGTEKHVGGGSNILYINVSIWFGVVRWRWVQFAEGFYR